MRRMNSCCPPLVAQVRAEVKAWRSSGYASATATSIWLHDVHRVRDKFDLLRFDASGAVSANMCDEDWPRYVLKLDIFGTDTMTLVPVNVG